MLALKLAFKNLIGAGLRTWLNVLVLSISYLVIVWHYSLLDGWNRQAKVDTVDWEIAEGQFWHKRYDPYDIFSLEDSHAPIPADLQTDDFVPVLVTQATIYPEGRMQSAILKGIDPGQKLLKLPTGQLSDSLNGIPALLGKRMAKSTRLKTGDMVTVRWRDVHGTFDATELRIAGIFDANVPGIDAGQIWLPIEDLQNMMQTNQNATIIVSGKPDLKNQGDFIFKTHAELMSEIDEIIKQKRIGGSFLYILLLALAMLAIFDTQVLAIFRRQKEIGTNIALGMTRAQVIRMFTVEGTMYALLAALVGAVYGIPLLGMQAIHGFQLPDSTENYGMTVAEKIYPVYSIWLIIITVLIVVLTSTIVSYLPTRKISKMKPTDAIRGKIQ